MNRDVYNAIQKAATEGKACLAILIDPEKFDLHATPAFLTTLPKNTTHLFVGGSTVDEGRCEKTVASLRQHTSLPIVLFPGDHRQITPLADAILFLSLLSGRNPEYLIGQHIKAVPTLQQTSLEVIPTSYLLIDGGTKSAVERVSQTKPLSQEQVEKIVHTAKAGELMGARLIYLEAGSGALFPVHPAVIKAVKKAITIPLIVGGGIRTEAQRTAAYDAGATLVVMGTVFEKDASPKTTSTHKKLIT